MLGRAAPTAPRARPRRSPRTSTARPRRRAARPRSAAARFPATPLPLGRRPRSPSREPEAVAARFRRGRPPVFCRTEQRHVAFDLRTVPPEDDERLAARDPVRAGTGMTPEDRAARRGHGRPRRPRQVRADPSAHRAWTRPAGRRRSAAGSPSTSGSRGPRCPPGGRSASSTCPGTSGSSATCSPGSDPVRLVLFVVAADEGWKPQSEEHLQIVDVLGVEGAVIALTKRDLVDDATLDGRAEDVREAARRHAAGRRPDRPLLGAPPARASRTSGRGAGRDGRGARRRPATGGRPRQFIDRVFTIRGTRDRRDRDADRRRRSQRGEEAEVLPGGHRARIRGLQTHRRAIERARPVSRVAVNLAGTATDELAPGDVLVLPGHGGPRRLRGVHRPVRGLAHASRPGAPSSSTRARPSATRGSASRRRRSRWIPAATAFARIRRPKPLVLDRHDRFVLREAGGARPWPAGG